MKLAARILALLLSGALVPIFAQSAPAFDHYLLNLSWSPEFCYSNPSNAECGGGHHYGFIVHGLWPEFHNGGGPEYCSHAPGPDPALAAGMLDIMPDLHLVEHEWQAHGTCSGLNASEYFKLVRKAFTSFRIPRQFLNPQARFAISPFDVKKAFEESNPSLNDAAVAIGCRGNYLSAVSICISKDLHPVPCPAVRDCRARMIQVTPVR
jgi:ribonuclease T2